MLRGKAAFAPDDEDEALMSAGPLGRGLGFSATLALVARAPARMTSNINISTSTKSRQPKRQLGPQARYQ